VTVVAGVQGVGKTSLILALAGILARGDRWGDGVSAPKGRALYIPAEGAASEIGEKLTRLGADIEGVDVLTGEGGDYLTIAHDFDIIRAQATGYDLLIFDSMTAHACDDLRKSEKARAFMNKLSALARETGAVVVVLHHLRKATVMDLGEGINQDRVRDSQDILAAARMAWGLEEKDDGYLVLSVIKSNLAGKPTALRLTIDDDGAVFVGEVEQRKEHASGWERAVTWLRAVLKDSPRESEEIRRLASGADITPKQLRRAREESGVITAWEKGRRMMWRLPGP
jgi:hypothetical protein